MVIDFSGMYVKKYVSEKNGNTYLTFIAEVNDANGNVINSGELTITLPPGKAVNLPILQSRHYQINTHPQLFGRAQALIALEVRVLDK